MKISLTAGWEDFLKIQRDERVILEHTVLGIICTRSFHFSPECTKIVSGWGSAPDPAGGAYSAPPDPLAVMGWDGDLVTTFFGCKLCAPLLVAGAPWLFWGWLRAWPSMVCTEIGKVWPLGPCQISPSEPIEKIFRTIDYDQIKKSSKIWFLKIFLGLTIHDLDLTFKRSNSAICVTFKILTGIFLKTVQNMEMVSIEIK